MTAAHLSHWRRMDNNSNLHCISVSNLNYKYGTNQVLDGISFDVDYGQIFGFLGPNGAGKTTTIRILTTLIAYSSGAVSIFGKDLAKQAAEIRKRMGVVLQQPSYEPNLTVERALDMHGRLWDVASGKRRDRVEELLHQFDLNEARAKKNYELSIGQRRRVQVAREFMHDMDLLFLDEPTVGLDPTARRALLSYIKKHSREGLTVFFTTHIMDEAEYLCDKMALISKGRIIALDTPAGLKHRYGSVKFIELRVVEDKAGLAMDLLGSVSGVTDAELVPPNVIRFSSSNITEGITKSLDLLQKHNVQVDNIGLSQSTLEDVFVDLTSEMKGK